MSNVASSEGLRGSPSSTPEHSPVTSDATRSHAASEVSASCGASAGEAALARIVDSWPSLPDHIKLAISALVESVRTGGGQ